MRIQRLLIVTCALALLPTIASGRATGSLPRGDSAKGEAISIEQTARGNIFVMPDTPAFRLDVQGGVAEIRWEASDYWGESKASGSLTPRSGQVELKFDPKALGQFRLDIQAKRSGGGTESVATTFACLSSFDVKAIDDSPFGVCTHFGQWWPLELVDLIAKAGIKEIRDEVYWGDFEKTRGRYELSGKCRRFLETLDRAGIRALVPLTYGNKLYGDGDGVAPHTPEMYEAYANYAAAIAQLSPGLVDAVEVWNEWNSPGFCSGPADSKSDVYLEMEKAVYRKVKRVNPSLPVAGCSTTGLWWGGYRWLEKYFALPGSVTNMDSLAVHPYNCALEPEYLQESMKKLQDMMKTAQGRTVPIWVTEIGYPQNLPSGKQPAPGFEYMSDKITTEAEQALFIVRTYAVLLANGVEKVHWYDFMNDGTDVHEGEQNFGMVRNPGDKLGPFTPKAGYASIATMARMLSGARFVRNESDDPLMWSLMFDKQGESIRLAWTLTPSVVRVRSRRRVDVRDLMGNPVSAELRRDEMRLHFPVGEPFYVIGPAEGIDAGLQVIIPDKARNAAGEAAIVPIEVKNRFGSSIPFKITVGDDELSLDAKAHFEGTLEGSIGRRDAKAEDRVPLTVEIGGRVLHKRPIVLEYEQQCVLSVAPYFIAGDELKLRVANASLKNALTITSIDWKIGGKSGSCRTSVSVEPEAEADVVVTGVEGPAPFVHTDARIDVNTNRGSYGWDVKITDAPCERASIRLDGSLSDWRNMPFVDLNAEGSVQKMTDHRGVSDLGGRFAIAHSRTHLYIAAEITDDKHHQPYTDEKVWMADCIQFAISDKQPWNSTGRYELSATLTPEGSELFAHETARGEKRGPVARGAVIKRVGNKTIYELAIPLKQLKLFEDTTDGIVGFSLLVNESDGGGRRGWIEWASGIGWGKDTSLYRPCRLVE